MASKRKITDYFDANPQANKRLMKNRAERGQIENIFARFPNLSEQIFGLLDYKTLARCNKVDRNWFQTLNCQRIYWIKMIHKSTSEKFCKDWMLAVNKAPFETLKKLAKLARKCSPKNELPLLHTVAKVGETDLFKFLVGKIGYKHEKGSCFWDNTPLHVAAFRGRFEIYEFIMGQSQIHDKNPQNKHGSTPFHYASRGEAKKNHHRHFEVCQLIFESIGHKNPSDKNGITPLHHAATVGNLNICQMIIEKIEEKNPGENDGSTPLHVAAKRGHFEIFKLIFDKIEVKNPRNQDGITPLHNAAKHGHLEICKLICSSIQEKNPFDNRGDTPIDLAMFSSVKNKLKQEFVLYEKNLDVIHFLIGEKNYKIR